MSIGIIRGSVVGPLVYESFSAPVEALVLHLEQATAVLRKGRLRAGVQALKIRPEPGVTKPSVGYVLPGDEFEVLQVVLVVGNEWWRVGLRQYVAHRYNGVIFTEYV